MGRFQQGNRAAVGNRGGGRPPRVYRALMEELSARSLREMWRVISDPTHPWHQEHGAAMLRDLVKITTPKLTQVGTFEPFAEYEDPQQPSLEELFEGEPSEQIS